MKIPEVEVKMPYALKVLRASQQLPGATTEAIKAYMGVTKQSVSARLSDLVDLGLLRYGDKAPSGTSDVGVSTFWITTSGRELLSHGNKAPALLRVAYRAYHDVCVERALAFARAKEEWRNSAAEAGQKAMRETLEAYSLI